MDIWKDKIEPQLADIEKWAENGVTETGCAANLHIDRKTWAKYRKAKKPLQEALFRGYQKAAKELRHALMSAACGGVHQDERVYEVTDNKGRTKVFRELRKYYVQPNVHACNLLLRNLDRDNWTEAPALPQSDKKDESSHDKLTDKQMNDIAARFANISAQIDKEAADIGIDAPPTPQN